MTDKDELQEAYLEGYATGRGTEQLKAISERTAKSCFERWYDLNWSETDE